MTTDEIKKQLLTNTLPLQIELMSQFALHSLELGDYTESDRDWLLATRVTDIGTRSVGCIPILRAITEKYAPEQLTNLERGLRKLKKEIDDQLEEEGTGFAYPIATGDVASIMGHLGVGQLVTIGKVTLHYENGVIWGDNFVEERQRVCEGLLETSILDAFRWVDEQHRKASTKTAS